MSNNPLQLTKLKICNLTKFEPPTVIPYSICVNFWVYVRKQSTSPVGIECSMTPRSQQNGLLGLHFTQISTSYIFPSLNSTYFSAYFSKKSPNDTKKICSSPAMQKVKCQLLKFELYISVKKGNFLGNRLTSCGPNPVNC